MNAIYARQSVDRADSISIESQIEFCQYEMRGEQYKVYTDRGYSGKNTDRPAFAEMMNDIENGVIGKVVVYKLDRISRSILDFSNMMEQFGTHKVEFVSTTEKFDTSSSAPISKMPDVPDWRNSRRSSWGRCRRVTVCWWCATRKRRRRSCSNRCKPRIAVASICPPPCASNTAGRLCKPYSPRWTSPPPTGKGWSVSPRR